MSTILKLHTSPSKWIFVLVVSCVFVLTGVWMLKESDNIVVAWASIIFFGLGIIVATINLLPNSNYLVISPEGLLVRRMFQDKSFRWSDFRYFKVHSIFTNSLVFYHVTDEYLKTTKMRSMSERLSHSEAFPDTYGKTAEDLSTLLNEWLIRHRSHSSAAHVYSGK